MHKSVFWLVALAGALASVFTLSSKAERAPDLGAVDMQLRWHHQFQFAGYYAALEQGYYREEGIEVRLHAGAPERQPVAEVLSGNAQYAEGNSEVLYHRLLGDPLVALAAIFQHSPSVLIARQDSGIRSVHDLVGKRVMLMDGMNDADFITMFLNEGISPRQVNILPSSYRVEDLVEGKVDAFNSYLTNEPFHLQQLGVPYTVIDPRNYRVDFYSDILFTTERELQENPERVAAFRRATLRGWRYAMEHPDDVIDLLLNKYKVQKTREHLEFEAEAMRPLVLPNLVPIGHMNPDRWEHMAETFVKAGLARPGQSLGGFIYDDGRDAPLPAWVLVALVGGVVVILLLSGTAVWVARANRKLAGAEEQLRQKNDALSQNLEEIQLLQQQLQEQVVRDSLTGLNNRRYLEETLPREVARAKREGYSVCVAMIDLDHFKRINDRYGHQAGDKVLKTLACLLHDGARQGDIACRYGGEEFVVVLPRLSLEHALSRMEQWRQAFATARTQHGKLEISATLSIGLALYPQNGTDAMELLAAADNALYRAKAEGRNRMVIAE